MTGFCGPHLASARGTPLGTHPSSGQPKGRTNCIDFGHQVTPTRCNNANRQYPPEWKRQARVAKLSEQSFLLKD
jgi:hypothetical protein